MSLNAQYLLEKLWAGTTTVADKQQLAALFGPGSNSVWRECWRQEFMAHPPHAAGPLSEEQSARVWAQLRWYLAAKAAAERTQRRQNWARWAVAAAILLAIGLVVRCMTHPAATLVPVTQALRAAVSVQLPMYRTNPNIALLPLPLPDGSVATLPPGSTVAYSNPFTHGWRNIRLNGAARLAMAIEQDDLAREPGPAGAAILRACGLQLGYHTRPFFSGEAAAADPLLVVLRSVCLANHLTFIPPPGLVTLRRSP